MRERISGIIEFKVLSKGKNGRPLDGSLSNLPGVERQTFTNQMITYFYVVASVEGPVFGSGLLF